MQLSNDNAKVVCDFSPMKTDFPQLKDEIYLDAAGCPPVPKPMLEAYFQDITMNIYGNPHSQSKASRNTQEAIDRITSRLAT